MSESPSNLIENAEEPAGKQASCVVLLDLVSPEIYRGNPFRLLGMSVLAGAREVTKRIDELKLAAEFGIAQPDWSFGPEQALSSEQIRAAAQALKEPGERLVWEVFWFWPENFPAEDGEDEAIGHLVRGETAQAVEYWQGAAMQGKPGALHNMAVYYHMRALELESQENPPEEELVQLWFKALRFWERVTGADAFWNCLKERVKRMADARVKEAFVLQMQASWPEALARICASLALDRARLGWSNRAALHAALVTHIHGDTSGARRALEECAAPIARRIDARLVEFRNRLARTEPADLGETWLLLRQCREDLAMIELLCSRTADYFVEISDGLADAALDGVVAFQRRTQDNHACLPLLACLLDFEALPELRGRIRETFDAVYRNAVVNEARGRVGGEDGQAELELEQVRAFHVITEHLLPALERLELGEPARLAYAARAAGMLRNLAVAVGLESDDLAAALAMFDRALELPIGDELRAAVESDRAQLQRDVEDRLEKQLQVETEGARLIVNRHGICFNDCWVAPQDVVGLRHGYLPETEEGGGGYLVAWRSADGMEFELNATNLLPPSTYVEEHYNRMLASIYFFVVPGLVDRMAAKVRNGGGAMLGATVLGPTGVVLPSPSRRFWLKDEPISYGKLQTSIEGGQLIVSSKDNPRQCETHDLALEWNACVFSYVVEALTRE